MSFLPSEHFQTRLPEMVELLRRLVELESPSTDKPALDALGLVVAAQMEQRGGALTRHPQEVAGDHWLGQWGHGPQSTLLLVHLDTVHPLGSLEHMPWREEHGRLYGPGVLDMKSGLVIGLFAIEAMRETGTLNGQRVSLLCTTDEETGSHSSRDLIVDLAREHDRVLCLEPPLADGSLKTSRSGIGVIELQVIGRSAHAGVDPGKGVNAIVEMAHQVLSLASLADPHQGTTLSPGQITGGSRVNVVPDHSRALVDVRLQSPAEQARIEKAVGSLQTKLEGSRLLATCDWNRPAMPRSQAIGQAFARAQELAKLLGLDLKEGHTGGGSDANFVAPLGIPLLDGLGAVGDGAHSEREHILKESLASRAALLYLLMTE